MTTRQLIIPITGMTCANCSATIERVTKKMPGVESAAVNLASERGTWVYDPGLVSQEQIIARIGDIGYGVATADVVLPIQGLHDETDARAVERHQQGECAIFAHDDRAG